MFDFIQSLFKLRDRKVTLIVWEDDSPDEPNSFSFFPSRLIKLFVLFGILILLTFGLTFYITPLGTFMYGRNDPELRESIIEISSRLLALQDSLQVRDMQLENMKDVLRQGADTTFALGRVREPLAVSELPTSTPLPQFSYIDYDFLRKPDVQFDAVSTQGLVFPVSFPVSGIVTQEYKPEEGHFGLDIAANVGSEFRSIADGVIISTEWTINYGYVIHVQHSDGYLSIYKHCANPLRKAGDIIRKDDILGTISDVGVISSGPHLHFEIWRNGRPLNPMNYLLN